jgi:hypothetical protein
MSRVHVPRLVPRLVPGPRPRSVRLDHCDSSRRIYPSPASLPLVLLLILISKLITFYEKDFSLTNNPRLCSLPSHLETRLGRSLRSDLNLTLVDVDVEPRCVEGLSLCESDEVGVDVTCTRTLLE